MKKLILITGTMLLLLSCKSSKPTVSYTETARYDSLYSLLSELRTNYSRTETKTTAIIDTLRNVALPIETSTNVLPTSAKRSELATSLAFSSAWIDSVGQLHHTLANKEKALLPSRKETTEHSKDTDKATSSAVTNTTKVTGDKITKEKKTEPVYVPVERFGGKFFYFSGWVLWVGLVVYTVWYLQQKTKLKPITRIINLIIKIFKK